MKTIAAIIPTRNEEIHMKRCIDSLSFASHIYVLDSESTDNTCNIANQMGCTIFNYPQNTIFSDKLNSAISRLQNYDLVIRVDADEIVSAGLSNLIIDLLASPSQLMPAYSVSRKLFFFSKILRRGGTSSCPIRLLNPKFITYQQTLIDEHVDLHGFFSCKLNGEIYDDPLHGYSHWLSKHISYSESEAKSVFLPKLLNQKAPLIRLYYKCPIFFRAFLLFFYRYILLLGFLDGKPGLYYHLSQTLLYRLMVDVRISSAR